MPTILLKKSDTPGSVPGTANLTNLAGGVEVAVNTADKRMFSMTSASAVIELGTNPSSLTCADASFTVARVGSLTISSLSLTNATFASATITNLTSTSATITNLINSGGTANGVLYLNGSKVATSGSAFVFDGTNVGIGTSSPATKLELSGSHVSLRGLLSLNSASGNVSAQTFYINSVYKGAVFADTSDNFNVSNITASGSLLFSTGSGTERMRLDSSGNLGIGTSSPAGKVHAYSTSGFAAPPLLCTDAVSNFRVVFNTSTYAGVPANKPWLHSYDDIYIGSDSSVACKWMSGGANTMTLNSSGNLGLGVTPSAWQTTSYKAFEFGIGGAIWGQTDSAPVLSLAANTYINSSYSYTYRGTGAATRYTHEDGSHKWFTAPSGTAGNAISFTQAMTLDASGNLIVGNVGSGVSTATPIIVTAGSTFANTSGDAAKSKIRVYSDSSGAIYGFGVSSLLLESHVPASAGFAWFTNNTERARITAAGEFIVGTTASSYTSAGRGVIEVNGSSQSLYGFRTGGTARGYLLHEATNLIIDNSVSTGAIIFQTNASEKARITAGGDLLVGTTTTSTGNLNGSLFFGGADAGIVYLERQTGTDQLRFYVGGNRLGYLNTASSTVTLGTANYPLAFATNDTERARITSGGTLLVGCTATPSASVKGFGIDFDVNGPTVLIATADTGSDRAIGFYNPNGLVGDIVTNGSATAYNTSSDRRLKENIVPADDAGSVVDLIQIVKHDWKVGGHVRYGVIAQDLHAVAPEAVKVGDDNEEVSDPWGVDYSKLVPMLVKEIQSLRARVAQLESK